MLTVSIVLHKSRDKINFVSYSKDLKGAIVIKHWHSIMADEQWPHESEISYLL